MGDDLRRFKKVEKPLGRIFIGRGQINTNGVGWGNNPPLDISTAKCRVVWRRGRDLQRTHTYLVGGGEPWMTRERTSEGATKKSSSLRRTTCSWRTCSDTFPKNIRELMELVEKRLGTCVCVFVTHWPPFGKNRPKAYFRKSRSTAFTVQKRSHIPSALNFTNAVPRMQKSMPNEGLMATRSAFNRSAQKTKKMSRVWPIGSHVQRTANQQKNK